MQKIILKNLNYLNKDIEKFNSNLRVKLRSTGNMIKAEIKVKTESMLHKYELKSANEPKKEDFPQSSQTKPKADKFLNIEVQDALVQGEIDALRKDYLDQKKDI